MCRQGRLGTPFRRMTTRAVLDMDFSRAEFLVPGYAW
jgi:hypothetical protein